MRFLHWPALIILLAVLVLGALFFSRNGPVTRDVELRPAPEFSLRDYNGQEVKLTDFRGKPLIINSWASWCPFCREELLNLAAARKEFGRGFAIIAIDRSEFLEVAKAYSDSLGISEEILFLVDPEDSFYKVIGGFSMPETIFVDKDGVVVFHKRGAMKTEELRRRIQDYFEF